MELWEKTKLIMKIYIAGSFTDQYLRGSPLKMIRLVRKNHPSAELFIPMDYKIEDDFQKRRRNMEPIKSRLGKPSIQNGCGKPNKFRYGVELCQEVYG